MLPLDGEWTDLTRLVQCRLGRSLFILDERPTGPGYRIFTPVTRIEPLRTPGPSVEGGGGDVSKAPKALIVDVDGTVSPVHGHTAWGDDVVAGQLFGPVVISPALCDRLNQLSQAPDLGCWWLTSWSAEMRARMNPFPGRDWPAIASEPDVWVKGRAWWKLTALEAWLDHHPEIRALAWCDDDLRGGRVGATRRRCASVGVCPLLISPRTSVGLTPTDVGQLERWSRA